MSSTTDDDAVVPEWTLGDRVRKAREHAGLSQAELADEIEATRQSISGWESVEGRVPIRAFLRAIAETTGVDYDWLVGDARRRRGLPRLDSNQQPTGNAHEPVWSAVVPPRPSGGDWLAEVDEYLRRRVPLEPM